MTDAKFTRRKYLKAVEASMVGSALVSAPVSAQRNDGNGVNLTEKIPHDISVSNNDYQTHEITVLMERQTTGEVEYERRFVLPGLNDPARDKSLATSKRANIQVPTGEMYEVTVQRGDSIAETFEWYIPAEGTKLVKLTTSVSPESELQIANSII